MSLRKYAEHRGCCLSSVQKAIRKGRINVSEDGTIDSDAADDAWESNTREHFSSTDTSKRAVSYRDLRNARLARELQLSMLELAVMNGELVEQGKVNRAAFERARRARDRLLMIPRRLSAQIAAEADAGKIRVLLQTAISDALEDLRSPNTVKPLWEASDGV